MAGAEVSVLPDSVLLHILELLPLRDRLRAARVCRRWQRLALDPMLWRRVDLSPYRVTLQTLWHLVRRHFGASLRWLRLRGRLLAGTKERLLSRRLLLALGRRCPHLQHLALAELDLCHLPYDSIPSSLTALELRRCEIPGAWFHGAAATTLPQLRHLLVHDVPNFNDNHLLLVSSRSRLQTLSLCGLYRLTTAGVWRAASHLGGLEHLVLRRCFRDSATATDILGCHLQRLRFLDISGTNLQTVDLAPLGALQHLETLHLDLHAGVSPKAILALGQALPQLRTLRLGGVFLGDEAMWRIQVELPSCACSYIHGPTA